ncbi:MAG TPA: SGNH/GDSL hydrolase family protein [Ktedonobacteraceae bacterium]|nr:SGNH/GDSL hydrolase family protein [Ktedonobacteraceae bacterium]
MAKTVRLRRRLAVPLLLAFALLFVCVPSTFAATANMASHHSLVGPKKHYLALGDSLAFGFQPDLNFDSGYADDFFSNLKNHGVKSLANMACPGETSVTFLNGKCPYPYLRKYPYLGSQMNAAVEYIKDYPGQVSPVTLDIGANDVNRDINPNNCTINQQGFQSDLAKLDYNLTQIILPTLKKALTINGKMTGDIVIMNYYDPYQNICPNTIPGAEEANSHLATDVSGFGTIVNVFTAFGGPNVPNPNICSYTWMCSFFTDIHATTKGYRVIANTFEKGYGY